MSQENKDLVQNDLFKGQETGFEETTNDSFKTPFFKIIEQLSPQINKSKPEYVEGAEAGMFFNTSNNNFYKELNVVVLKVAHELVAWAPNRGGYKGRYPKYEEQKIVKRLEGFKKIDEDGNELQDTLSFYLMNADDPTEIAILPLSVMRFKDGKNWATRIRSLKYNNKLAGVSWAGVWNIKLTNVSNDKGDWHSLGNTPKFERFITLDERDGFILPALEMLKNVEIDYSNLSSEETKSKEASDKEVEF